MIISRPLQALRTRQKGGSNVKCCLRGARRKASAISQGDHSEQLYTITDGITGIVNNAVSLPAVPSLDALLELDEMSANEFNDAVKAGDFVDMVVIRPEYELNSSSLMDEAVLSDTKQALSARSGSAILKNSSDPFYPLVKEFQDVVCHDPPSSLPPDRGVRHECKVRRHHGAGEQVSPLYTNLLCT